MSDLTQLYQEIILSHNKNPHNYGSLQEYSGKAVGRNPLCGDEVTVYWKIEDGLISSVVFQAQGCAISRASASMMTELLIDKTDSEARQLFGKLKNRLNDLESREDLGEEFGDLNSLSGVRKYPSRIKCATLAWETLIENL